MMDFQDLFIILTILFILIISPFAASAEDLNNSFNESRNITNETMDNELDAPIQPMSIWITLDLNTTHVNLGELIANNQINSYPNITRVSLSAFLWGSLYIRASGDFTNGTDTSRYISLNNFQYDGFDNHALDHEPFSTTPTEVKSWGFWGIDENNIPVNYYLTVPYGTDPAVYNVTVIYSVT